MLRWFFSRKAAAPPLRGAPLQAREKSYTAQSGYVYSYFYCGFRNHEEGTTEFVFKISADRKNWREAAVRQEHACMSAWEHANQRTFTAAERYAIAKMALFQAFDECEAPDAMNAVLKVGLAEIGAIVETLGL